MRRSAARAASVWQAGRRLRPDHRPSRRAAHADADERADRGRARDLLCRPPSRSTSPMRADGRQGHGEAAARDALLTPIAKACSTDVGSEVASLGVQVHGGMGFIEETGAAQYYRDARITPIYEGTNGIQAIDLVARKLARQRRRLGVCPARRAQGHRRPRRGLERSRLRHHGRETARRAGLARPRQPLAAGTAGLRAERCARGRDALSAAVRRHARRLHARRRGARRARRRRRRARSAT